MTPKSMKFRNCANLGLALAVAMGFVCGGAALEMPAQWVSLSSDAEVCVLEIASYWPQEQKWRTSRLYGDGRLEVRDSPTKSQASITRQFARQLTQEDLERVRAEIADSGLYAFSSKVAETKERATGRGRPYASESTPTDFRISWMDAETRDQAAKVVEFHLTYGGAETLMFPEIPEYGAANRLVLWLLNVDESN